MSLYESRTIKIIFLYKEIQEESNNWGQQEKNVSWEKKEVPSSRRESQEGQIK